MRRAAYGALLGVLLAGGPLCPAHGQSVVEVRIVQAEEMRPMAQGGATVFRLLRNVVLQHDSAIMRCDSAHVDQQANTFDAYGHVRIRSQELRIQGETLYYDGNTGKGRIVGSPVVLRDTVQKSTLWSDELFFNTRENTAEYHVWGRIRSGKNVMESSRGHYASRGKIATVWRAVTFRGEKVDAYTDSLIYHQLTERAYFWGPTRLYETHRMAYGLQGWYDQRNDELEIQREVMADDGAQRIFADWFYGNKRKAFVEAKGRVVLEDSLSRNRLYTQHLRYWHDTQLAIADEWPMVFALDTSGAVHDTLTLRADTLRTWREVRRVAQVDTTELIAGLRANDSTSTTDGHRAARTRSRGEMPLPNGARGAVSSMSPEELANNSPSTANDRTSTQHRQGAQGLEGTERRDTLWRNDTVHFAKGIGRVRAYKRNAQLIADTAYFSGVDSTVTLSRAPFPYLWSDSSQASAQTIVAYVGKNKLDSVHLNARAIVAMRQDSVHFDQVGAEQIRSHFHQGALRVVHAAGDARMVYYMVDGNEMVGINRVECPDFRALVENNQPYEVTFYHSPKSSMLPLRETSIEDRQLYGFEWREDLRPQGRGDVVPTWLTDFDYYVPVRERALGYRKIERVTLERVIEIPAPESSPHDLEVANGDEGVRDITR